MLLREFFPGVLPPKDAGPGGNAGKPVGAGKEWKFQGSWPYTEPPAEISDEEELTDTLRARFSTKVGNVVPRRDAGYARPDAGNFLGNSRTFNALAESLGLTPPGGVGFMPNSIVPLVHFNRMTNRTQDPDDPAQIPNITSGPGVKNRTGTVYGTSHATALAGDDSESFIPGRGDILPDRDERGLLKSIKRFRDLQSKRYGHQHQHGGGLPIVFGEWK